MFISKKIDFSVCSIGMLVVSIFLILTIPILSGQELVYGSMFSFQFFANTTNYFDAIKNQVYPFFHFDLALGFNALGDSQGSMLHPVKLVLAWLLETPYQLDSYFLIFHLALLFLA